MTMGFAAQVFRWARYALPFEAFLAFAMFFQPSWSNGLPGFSRETALATGFAGMAVLMSLTGLALAAPRQADLVSRCPEKRRRIVSLATLGGAGFLAVFVGAGTFVLVSHFAAHLLSQ